MIYFQRFLIEIDILDSILQYFINKTLFLNDDLMRIFNASKEPV